MSEEKIINIGKDDEYKVNTICNNVIQACREMDKALEEIAIEEVKKIINYIEDNYTCNCDREDKEYFEIVLNLIDKQQKAIDLMAEHIYEHDISTTGLYEWRDNEQIKECFYKKVEEEQ